MEVNSASNDGWNTPSLKDVILNFEDLPRLEIKENCKYFDWLVEQSLNLLFGRRGFGKSWAALSISDCITKGISLGPWQTLNPVPILYWDGEMTVTDMKERLGTLNRIYPVERKQPLYLLSDHYMTTKGMAKGNLANESWRKELKEVCVNSGIKILVIDNLSSLCPGVDENSKKEWDPINQWLLDLQFHGLSVILLHHVSKGGDERGTSAREDNLNVSIELKRPSDYAPEQGCRFIFTFTKSRIWTKDPNSIAEYEFQLGENGWSFGSPQKKKKFEILRMIGEDVIQADIARKLGLTRGAITRHVDKLTEEGYLTPKKKLTDKGRKALSEWIEPVFTF